jgi:hypothetical protein
MVKTIEQKGKKWTVDHYKKLHIIAKAIAMNSTFTPLEWTRSGKDGIPSVLRQLVPYLTGSPEDKRFALTLTRSYELVIGKAEINLSPIEDPLAQPIPSELLSGFTTWVQQWRTVITGRKFYTKLSPMQKLLASPGVAGPNGPALLTSHIDAIAVSRAPHLLKSIHFFSPFLAEQVVGLARHSKSPKEPILSKIAFLSEGGMKTRTIAIGDFWTQNALRPLHDSLMGILRRLETDGTWNQDKQSERIKLLANEESTSFDLSSATDRFPIAIQRIVIEAFYGPDVARNWENLMINRDFRVDSKRSTRWSVGQPLGFLSSWAAFALTHHAIIEYCAYLEGFKTFRDYAVLGDDVVIWSASVAKRYKSVMESLSVQINMTKTITSSTGHTRVEFAKRLFYQGVEISGLSWNLIKQASISIAGIVDLYLLAQSRSWSPTNGSSFRAPASLSDKGTELFGLLYWERTGGQAPLPVNLKYSPTLPELSAEVLRLRWEKLLKLQMELDSVLCGNKPMQDLFKSQGLEIEESLLGYGNVMHPIVDHVNNMGMTVWDTLALFPDPKQVEESEVPPVLPVEYFPNLNTSLYFGDRRVLLQVYHSKLVWRAYYSLLAKSAAEDVCIKADVPGGVNPDEA